MRVRRLTVRDFRKLSELTVELPETGTTVIVGDNEVGKSSLVEALAVLFELRDDSKAARIRRVQPAGRDVGPEVEAELTLGPHRLRYAKRWLKGRYTELTITGGRSFTGREAHDEAARLFAEHVDPVLWQTLMVGQGQSLVQPAPADAEPLIAAVTSESGIPDDGASMPLVTAVAEEYLRYWTPTGRPTADFARSAAALASAEQVVADTTVALDAVTADVHRAERLTQEVADLKVRLDEHHAELELLDRDAKAAESLLLRRDGVLTKAELARARLASATGARTTRERLVAEHERWTSTLEELEARGVEVVAAAERSGAAAEETRATLTTAVQRQAECREEAEDAQALVTRAADLAELDRLTGQQASLESARRRIAAAGRTLEGISVDNAGMVALEQAHSAVATAVAALTAGAPEISVRRLAADGAEAELSDGSTIAPGAAADRIVDGELRIVVPDELEVTVRAGAGVAALRAAVDAATKHEQELLERYGVDSLSSARELLRRRDVAAAELAEARRTEQSLTAGGDPAARIAELTARLDLDSDEAEHDEDGQGLLFGVMPGIAALAPGRPTVRAVRTTESAQTGRRQTSRRKADRRKAGAAGPHQDGTAPGGAVQDKAGTDGVGPDGPVMDAAGSSGAGSGVVGSAGVGSGGASSSGGAGGVNTNEVDTGGLGLDGSATDGRGADGAGTNGGSRGLADGMGAETRLRAARAALAVADKAAAEAEFAAAQAQKAADADRAAVQQLATRTELATEQSAAAEQALTAARAELADEDLLATEDAATAEVEVMLDEVSAIQAEVEEAGAEELTARAADAREVLARLRTEYDELRDRLRTTEGRLEQAGRAGLASRLDDAVLELDRARSEHETLRRRAEAARRVQDTLSRHRADAQARYSAPLQERIEALGHGVYGPTFRVALDDDLVVSERELDGIRLPVEDLSTGAREQLAIITRLAISQLVGSGTGHVPVILDDALGWSDKGRLREMGALLGHAGEHGQVIILTCVAERYEYVPKATVIRLDPAFV